MMTLFVYTKEALVISEVTAICHWGWNMQKWTKRNERNLLYCWEDYKK